MSAERELSPRQKRAVEAFVGQSKGNKTAALKAAGYPKSMAESQTRREWTPDMAAYARELLDREGITDQVLVSTHKRLLLKARSEDVQMRALQLGYQVKGLLKADADATRIVDRLVGVFMRVVVTEVPEKRRGAVFDELEQALPLAVTESGSER